MRPPQYLGSQEQCYYSSLEVTKVRLPQRQRSQCLPFITWYLEGSAPQESLEAIRPPLETSLQVSIP